MKMLLTVFLLMMFVTLNACAPQVTATLAPRQLTGSLHIWKRRTPSLFLQQR